MAIAPLVSILEVLIVIGIIDIASFNLSRLPLF